MTPVKTSTKPTGIASSRRPNEKHPARGHRTAPARVNVRAIRRPREGTTGSVTEAGVAELSIGRLTLEASESSKGGILFHVKHAGAGARGSRQCFT
jgi:hypothetical protein